MTGEERALRDEICRLARIAVRPRADGGVLGQPVGAAAGRLPDRRRRTAASASSKPAALSKLDAAGAHVAGDPPTKEVPLHMAFYGARPQAGGVVHLHSTYATALSCLADTDPEDAIPPITPYVVMRVGRVPLIPYTRPGSAEVAPLIAAKAAGAAAVLLANHGPVVSARTFRDAVFAAEELEETAKLVLLTRGMQVRRLSAEQVAALSG